MNAKEGRPGPKCTSSRYHLEAEKKNRKPLSEEEGP